MKYVVLTVSVLAVCFGVSYLFARFLRGFFRTKRKKLLTTLITLIAGLFLMVIIGLGYMSIYYSAGEHAKAALLGSATVTVEKIDGGYFFDGPSDSEAIIFYPGAKVDSAAYAPLMLRFAESGYDCFLAEMPFHFALLGSDAADTFLKAYSYDTWIMAGHSMGGLVAASYANSHTERVDGIILLAAYAISKLDDGLKLCSIYGSEDGCLEREVYRNGQSCWPSEARETVIEGGNHAQFGDYGLQTGDGSANITAEEQQEYTVRAISAFFG